MAPLVSVSVPARATSWTVPVYAFASALLIAGYPLLPTNIRNAEFVLISFLSMVPVTVGLRRAAPDGRRPWWLMLGALGASTVASALFRWPTGAITGPAQALDTVGSVLFLAGALTIVIRRGRNDVGGLIDATIVSFAAGGLLWSIVLLPRLHDATDARRAWVFASVFLLSGVLGTLARLVMSARTRLPALRLLLTAVVLALTAKVTLVVWPGPSAYTAASMMFMAAYTAVGLFGLDPTSAQLANPARVPTDRLNRARLVFLGAALASMPTVMGVRALLGLPVDGLLLVAGSLAIVPLVMWRVGRLAAERTRAELALLHEATHDPLTGAVNRREFTAQLAAELTRPGPCAVLFFDLDDFKAVNDRLGHTGGDRLLVEVTARLNACVREGDLVGRFGGDEFLVLVRQAGLAETGELTACMTSELTRPIALGPETVVIGASVGLAGGIGGLLTDPHSEEAIAAAEALIDQADQAMYGAKTLDARRVIGAERRF